ncbi:arsenate reductase ArsC [Salegentibacter chungangensis]|uniref:Arsenate reductase ArsC n=1 Tax=Salegentibacter chungangensis TaxID=1335724 RepID=A0ABW3NNT8_9FLAO
MEKKKVLVLCAGNSSRSQMAEAYLRLFGYNRALYYSAGIRKEGVNPRAKAIMQEDGINISDQSCKLLSEYANRKFDYIISLCNEVKDICPEGLFSGCVHLHSAFRDPDDVKGSEQKIYNAYRESRDDIKKFCRRFVTNHL